jgi:hypothetical protein
VKGTYAYSLDRENFTGVYNTRAEAVEAGLERASQLSTPINEIYVGQRATGDPQANLHVWSAIKSMRDRARAAYGDAAHGYLASVTAAQAEDLDRAFEAVILRWLQNYKLGPTFYRIEAISEHPVPAVQQVRSDDGDEVYDLGSETEYPLSR